MSRPPYRGDAEFSCYHWYWQRTSTRPRRITTLTRCGRLPLRQIQQRSQTSVIKGPRLSTSAWWPTNVSPRSRRSTWQDHCRVNEYKRLDLRTKRSKSSGKYFQLIQTVLKGFYLSDSQQYGVRVQKGWEHSVILVAATGWFPKALIHWYMKVVRSRCRPRRISTLTRCGRLPLREIQQCS